MTNLALIIPAALRDDANQLGELMGWGPNSYSVALSADGSEPATHYGLNLANAQPEFLAMLQAAGEGQMPQALADAGYPQETFDAIIGALIQGLDSFAAVIAANGLVKVEVEI